MEMGKRSWLSCWDENWWLSKMKRGSLSEWLPFPHPIVGSHSYLCTAVEREHRLPLCLMCLVANPASCLIPACYTSIRGWETSYRNGF